MIGFKTLVIAAMMSMGAATSASAQLPDWAASDPGSFEAQYPNRDVLNGGALTPAGRMSLELPSGIAPVFAPKRVYRATGTAAASSWAQRYHSYDATAGTFRSHHGRRYSSE